MLAMMRFVHTADWQIGKPFLKFGEKAESLRNARLDAIEALGKLATESDATHILVAGDVFDNDTPSDLTLLAPLQRMRSFPRVSWHLLPGNHDPHRPAGVWDRFRGLGLPGNILVHVTHEPFALQNDCYLLPAPLTNKAEVGDITAAMDQASTPEGAIRIGLAHGHVTDFRGNDGNATNLIDPDRASRAGLSYLALGDWHRTQRVNDRTWYARHPRTRSLRSRYWTCLACRH